VAGPPGAGKTTVARLLLAALEPVPALLDKDTMYGPFVAAVLAAAGRPPGEREGAWYDEHIKVHEYAGLTATAREIRAAGCAALLSGPFTSQIHDLDWWRSWGGGRGGAPGPRWWRSWTGELGGPPVHLVWVRADAATLLRRLAERGLERDRGKLADFGAFTASMQLNAEPAAPHHTIDNRLTAAEPVESQVRGYVRSLGLQRAVRP